MENTTGLCACSHALLWPQRWELPRPWPEPGSPSVSHLSAEDQGAAQFREPHSCCLVQLPPLLICLLLSALLFSFWAPKPAFIWMMESLVTPGVTARGSRRRVAASFLLMCPQVWSTSCVFVCLFLFLLLTVCCTLIGKSHMWKKAWRDRVWPSRRHSRLWDFHL